MIRFENFRFRYSNSQRFALRDINLKIEDGEFVMLVGNSGSGKSTFLRAINSLIPHFYGGEYCGRVSVYGKNPENTAPRDMTKIVGTVLQDPENQLLMNEVGREIAFPLENMGLSAKEITKRVEDILNLLDIEHLRHRKIENLSGGEKQKVAIASAMAMHPRVLLLDEPTSQLDPKSAESIISLIERINDELGTSILLVEHRLENTVHRADRLIVLRDGEVIGDGEPRVIMEKLDMDALGIGYPPVARVARMFHKDYLPLTVKEARKVLEDVFLGVEIKEKEEMVESVVSIINLQFGYSGKKVLTGLNFDIPSRGVTGIIGRNGSGKTTLAKIIAGILKPQGGKIKYRVKKNEIGMVFQNPNLHVIGKSVYEDIAYTLRARNEKNVEERTMKVLKTLGLEELKDRNPLDLSGGERLLFALGTIIVFSPKLLILDEPTRGLSYGHKIKLEELLREYSKSRAILLISHDMELIAKLSSKVALLSEGKIVLEGNKREILSSSLSFSPQLNKLVQRYEGVDKRILTEEDLK